MKIKVRGAREHNLKNISLEIGDGLTVVSGVSGSGKTSLIFDTIYNEARRRFLDVYNMGRAISKLSPSNVDAVTGIGPTIAVEQNLLNRNPNSSLASASGMHPFLRILFARFGLGKANRRNGCRNSLRVNESNFNRCGFLWQYDLYRQWTKLYGQIGSRGK